MEAVGEHGGGGGAVRLQADGALGGGVLGFELLSRLGGKAEGARDLRLLSEQGDERVRVKQRTPFIDGAFFSDPVPFASAYGTSSACS